VALPLLSASSKGRGGTDAHGEKEYKGREKRGRRRFCLWVPTKRVKGKGERALLLSSFHTSTEQEYDGKREGRKKKKGGKRGKISLLHCRILCGQKGKGKKKKKERLFLRRSIDVSERIVYRGNW